MNKIDINNLTGKCLVSMPDTFSENPWKGAVIYICSHGSDGAMGFIINKPIKEFSFADLATELPFSAQNLSMPLHLYNGGPVEKAKGFILHSDDYQINGSLKTGGGIAVSSSLEVLRDIADGNGPKQRIIALGYAGWAPHQLEAEIANNQWLITDATPELVLGGNDDCKWQQAVSSLGINFGNFISSIGQA